MNAIEQLVDAAHFAAQSHWFQRRKNAPEMGPEGKAKGTPYVNHPLAVAQIISQIGKVDDVVVLCAAMLHDTIEDTDVTEADLRARFGDTITEVVLEVSDDKSLPKQRRKELQIEHAAHASLAAQLVKLGDKINNLTDLVDCPPPNWPVERRRNYFDWAKKVIDQVRGANALLEAEFDRIYAQRP